MWDVSFTKAAGAFGFGLIVGYFAAIAIPIWSVAVWSVFGQGRSLADFSWKKPPPTSKALRRLLLWLPFIAVVHPLPWVLVLLVWFLYQLLSGAIDPMWWWFSLSFFGWLAWAALMIFRPQPK